MRARQLGPVQPLVHLHTPSEQAPLPEGKEVRGSGVTSGGAGGPVARTGYGKKGF